MIGGTFEYLVSSLPRLSFDNSEEVKARVFNLLKKYAGDNSHKKGMAEILDGEVQKFLPSSTFSDFQKIDLRKIHEPEFQESKSIILSSFSKFMLDMKNEIRDLRISQKENDEKASSRIGKLIGEGTPLEKEVHLMKYQWEKLEELSVGHFANLEALVTYKIKLMILSRWWSFDLERGFDNYTRMTTNN